MSYLTNQCVKLSFVCSSLYKTQNDKSPPPCDLILQKLCLSSSVWHHLFFFVYSSFKFWAGTSDRYTILPEIDGIDIDKELRESLSAPLKDVSRQRLRAIRISFRRLGNTDNRVSTKDILVVLGEHNVRISNRTYQMIIRKFETAHGVDYEGLWTYMVEAQSKTG